MEELKEIIKIKHKELEILLDAQGKIDSLTGKSKHPLIPMFQVPQGRKFDKHTHQPVQGVKHNNVDKHLHTSAPNDAYKNTTSEKSDLVMLDQTNLDFIFHVVKGLISAYPEYRSYHEIIGFTNVMDILDTRGFSILDSTLDTLIRENIIHENKNCSFQYRLLLPNQQKIDSANALEKEPVGKTKEISKDGIVDKPLKVIGNPFENLHYLNECIKIIKDWCTKHYIPNKIYTIDELVEILKDYCYYTGSSSLTPAIVFDKDVIYHVLHQFKNVARPGALIICVNESVNTHAIEIVGVRLTEIVNVTKKNRRNGNYRLNHRNSKARKSRLLDILIKHTGEYLNCYDLRDKYIIAFPDDIINESVSSTVLSLLYSDKILNKSRRVSRVKKGRSFYYVYN